MKIKKVYCLFEQSGTFKKAFRELGIEAEDYDILNDFGETDHQIDLFVEIEKAYTGKPSLFDEISKDDLCLAFFPCTRFQAYNCANLQGKNYGMRDWDLEQRLENSIKLHDELNMLYKNICKLFIVAIRGGYKACSRESLYAAALFNALFPRRTQSYHQRPLRRRRLLFKTDTIFLLKLRARAKRSNDTYEKS